MIDIKSLSSTLVKKKLINIKKIKHHIKIKKYQFIVLRI